MYQADPYNSKFILCNYDEEQTSRPVHFVDIYEQLSYNPTTIELDEESEIFSFCKNNFDYRFSSDNRVLFKRKIKNCIRPKKCTLNSKIKNRNKSCVKQRTSFPVPLSEI